MTADPSLFLNLASTGMDMWGQYAEGQQKNKAYKYNASLADMQAEQVLFKGRVINDQLTRQGKKLLSSQEAGYAKSGVSMSGSPLEVMLDSATNIEYDKSIADYNIKMEELSFRSEAQLSRYYGKLAKNKALYNMGMTLLGSAQKMSNTAGPSTGGQKSTGGGNKLAMSNDPYGSTFM